MYRVLDETDDNTVGIHVDGRLTKDDYAVLIPYFEDLIEESGPLNLLCHMTKVEGTEIEAFWKDFKLSIRHLHEFKRMAIVGDQGWFQWWTKLLNPLVKTEVKYFPPHEIDDAWTWVKSSRGGPLHLSNI